jgi:hypothetical protein
MATDHIARYRQRAADMRKLAARAQSEHLRYLDIAQEWDRLAEQAEQGVSATPSPESASTATVPSPASLARMDPPHKNGTPWERRV